MHHQRKANVTITFHTPADALDWFERCQAAGLIGSEAALVQPDGLDELVGSSGVPGANRFLVRRADDRPMGVLTWSDKISDRVVIRS